MGQHHLHRRISFRGHGLKLLHSALRFNLVWFLHSDSPFLGKRKLLLAYQGCEREVATFYDLRGIPVCQRAMVCAAHWRAMDRRSSQGPGGENRGPWGRGPRSRVGMSPQSSAVRAMGPSLSMDHAMHMEP